MIDLATEHSITLARGAELLPPLRGGRPVHPKTLVDWAKHGLKAPDGTNVYLEVIRIGKTQCTSIEAIQRFCDRLSGPPATTLAPLPPRLAQRARDAARECEALGL